MLNLLFNIPQQVRVRIYVKCPYSKKDECKTLGGKYDPEKKLWYFIYDLKDKIELEYSTKGFPLVDVDVCFDTHRYLDGNLLIKIFGNKEELNRSYDKIFQNILYNVTNSYDSYKDEFDRLTKIFDDLIKEKLKDYIKKKFLNENNNSNGNQNIFFQ